MPKEFYEDPVQGINELRDRVNQAGDIQNFLLSWYDVQSFEDLPPEGREWYEIMLLAAGWEAPENTNE